jgi:hypothetical protein
MLKMAQKRKGILLIVFIALVVLGIGVIFLTFKYGKDVFRTFFHPHQIEVKLYFSHPQAELLMYEKRWLTRVSNLHDQVFELIQELIKGPNSKGIRTIPPTTRLRGLKIKDRIAFLDFTTEISREHPGGSTAELLTIYSIVNSLILNFPEIKKVQLLVEGQKVDTLAGHINCRYPLIERGDLIARE